VIKCLCILRCAECDHSASQMTLLVIEDFHILWIQYLHTSQQICFQTQKSLASQFPC
jgi:hypothetical protein